jgi:hypothetical protein
MTTYQPTGVTPEDDVAELRELAIKVAPGQWCCFAQAPGHRCAA